MINFKIEGLDCANCARELEEEIAKISGVKEATVDFMAQKVYVECDGTTLEKVKDVCNHFEEVKVVEEPTAAPAANAVQGEKIKITGLCCANCARELEEDLNKLDGVSAVVDFMNMQVNLAATSADAFRRRENRIRKARKKERIQGTFKGYYPYFGGGGAVYPRTYT